MCLKFHKQYFWYFHFTVIVIDLSHIVVYRVFVVNFRDLFLCFSWVGTSLLCGIFFVTSSERQCFQNIFSIVIWSRIVRASDLGGITCTSLSCWVYRSRGMRVEYKTGGLVIICVDFASLPAYITVTYFAFCRIPFCACFPSVLFYVIIFHFRLTSYCLPFWCLHVPVKTLLLIRSLPYLLSQMKPPCKTRWRRQKVLPCKRLCRISTRVTGLLRTLSQNVQITLTSKESTPFSSTVGTRSCTIDVEWNATLPSGFRIVAGTRCSLAVLDVWILLVFRILSWFATKPRVAKCLIWLHCFIWLTEQNDWWAWTLDVLIGRKTDTTWFA